MIRPGPISADPTPGDCYPAAVWPGGRPTARPVRPRRIGPVPIVVVDHSLKITDAEQTVIRRQLNAWIEATGGNGTDDNHPMRSNP